MKTVRFWKVETPYAVRYFENEQEADALYYASERATITTFTRRNEEKIAAIRDKIAEDKATEKRMAEEMKNLDARAAEWCAENK